MFQHTILFDLLQIRIHPQSYTSQELKYLEKGAHQSQLGRQKKSWFLAGYKTEILYKIEI